MPLPWAETYDLNLNSGARLTTVKQLIPDISGAIQSVLYSLLPDEPHRDGGSYRRRRSRRGATNFASTVRSNGYVDFRTTGRDIPVEDQDWRFAWSASSACHACDGRPASDRLGSARDPLMPSGQPALAAAGLPDIGRGQSTLANYLRTFSLWCRHGFADKLSATTAARG